MYSVGIYYAMCGSVCSILHAEWAYDMCGNDLRYVSMHVLVYTDKR